MSWPHFDFKAAACGARCPQPRITKGDSVSFTFPAGAVEADDDSGPIIGIFHTSGDALVHKDMWYRATKKRSTSGFDWESTYLPPPGVYLMKMIPNGGDHDSPIGELQFVIADANAQRREDEGPEANMEQRVTF